MEESKLKLNLLEYTTIIYAFLTFLGYSYIDTYYKHWDITIYSFLDASEILLLFLNNINFLILIILSLTTAFVGFLAYRRNLASKQDNPNDSTSPKYKWKRLLIEGAVVIAGVVLIYLLFSWNTSISNIIMELFTLVWVLYIFNNLLPNWLKSKNILINKHHFQIALVILFIVRFNVLCADYKYIRMNEFNKTEYSFNYELITYKSSDSLLYIGSTSKYLFLRNTKKEINLIFEKGSLKNHSLIEKKIMLFK